MKLENMDCTRGVGKYSMNNCQGHCSLLWEENLQIDLYSAETGQAVNASIIHFLI